uniref:Uncharacterized protein n=1 Tax=Caenorhabditis tropicalis TaxID=1561998 RepID=A0A1I7V2W7_9PELO
MYPLRLYVYTPNYCDPIKFLNREWARYLRIYIPEFFVDSNPEVLEMGVIELSEEGTDQLGFHRLTDWIKNFAESRLNIAKRRYLCIPLFNRKEKQLSFGSRCQREAECVVDEESVENNKMREEDRS